VQNLIQHNFTLYMDLTSIGKSHFLKYSEGRFEQATGKIQARSTILGVVANVNGENICKQRGVYKKLLDMARYPRSKQTVDNIDLEISYGDKTAYPAEESTIESKCHPMERSIETGNLFQ